MTYCSTYIGNLDDPDFDPDGSGNIPRALAPAFPPLWQHYNGAFHDWVKQRQIPIKESDYSAYVAQVTKAQIEDYIAFAYGAVEVSESGTFRLQELERIKSLVATFASDKLYALVAECD